VPLRVARRRLEFREFEAGPLLPPPGSVESCYSGRLPAVAEGAIEWPFSVRRSRVPQGDGDLCDRHRTCSRSLQREGLLTRTHWWRRGGAAGQRSSWSLGVCCPTECAWRCARSGRAYRVSGPQPDLRSSEAL